MATPRAHCDYCSHTASWHNAAHGCQWADPDSPESRALHAAQTISVEAGRLWMLAYADGVREGISMAATYIDQAVKQISDDYSIDADIRLAAILVCEHLRDQFRLSALSVTEPSLPTPPWER